MHAENVELISEKCGRYLMFKAQNLNLLEMVQNSLNLKWKGINRK